MKSFVVLLLLSQSAYSDQTIDSYQKDNLAHFGKRYYGENHPRIEKKKNLEDPDSYYKRTGQRMSVEDYNQYLRSL